MMSSGRIRSSVALCVRVTGDLKDGARQVAAVMCGDAAIFGRSTWLLHVGDQRGISCGAALAVQTSALPFCVRKPRWTLRHLAMEASDAPMLLEVDKLRDTI